MIVSIPLNVTPNQELTVNLNGISHDITLETRLGKLYLSAKTSAGVIISNRVCLDRTYIDGGFVFIDLAGRSDPTHDLLNTRFVLVWSDDFF